MSRRAALVIATLALYVGGCAEDPSRGYVWGSAYDQGVRTLSAPIFENRTYYYGVEAELAEALAKSITKTTPWRLSSEAAADTSLRGVIQDVNLRKLSTDQDSGLVQEMAVTITVDFEWVDNRTGEILVARRRFTGAGAFAPARPAQERVETGRLAAVEALARDIVAELRSDW